MEQYVNFAQVYELFMEEVPYDQWAKNFEYVWNKYGIKPNTIVDLGCGTGKLTYILKQKGYDLIGIDISSEMLSQATSYSPDILYLNQNMTNFELFNKVDCFISACDSINYLLEEKDLLNVFNQVSKYLNKNGIFIFDVNTVYKYKNILGNNSFSEAKENCAYIWDNFYDENKNINEYYVSFFIENEKGLYERYEEVHYQRSYSIDQIKSIIEKSNLQCLEVLDSETMKQPQKTSERIYFVLKEKSK